MFNFIVLVVASSNHRYRYNNEVYRGMKSDWQDDKERNRGRCRWLAEVSKERYFRNVEENYYTIIIDNLPISMLKSWLSQLFSFEGRIVDIYIATKRRRNSSMPFAFVHFSERRMPWVLLEI